MSSPGAEELGFKFVGGVEFEVGVFVCDVLPKSQAEKKGLKVSVSKTKEKQLVSLIM